MKPVSFLGFPYLSHFGECEKGPGLILSRLPDSETFQIGNLKGQSHGDFFKYLLCHNNLF